jgi:hypothetical protein
MTWEYFSPMKLTIQSGVASFETKIALADFPPLVNAHLSQYLDTPELEILGQELLASGFSDEILEQFIRRVCYWGGYSGIVGRVFKRNTLADIKLHFGRAATALHQDVPDLKAALQAINTIKGLGTPSFSSKQLRFLFPDRCPILDTVTKSLGYQFNAEGYAQFATDCATIARTLEMAAIPNPRNRPNNRWFVGNIDMALFAYLNEWTNEPSRTSET